MALFRLCSNFLTPTVNGATLHYSESKNSTSAVAATVLSSRLLTGSCRNNISFQVMGERYYFALEQALLLRNRGTSTDTTESELKC
jgi:hypothetical protein